MAISRAEVISPASSLTRKARGLFSTICPPTCTYCRRATSRSDPDQPVHQDSAPPGAVPCPNEVVALRPSNACSSRSVTLRHIEHAPYCLRTHSDPLYGCLIKLIECPGARSHEQRVRSGLFATSCSCSRVRCPISPIPVRSPDAHRQPRRPVRVHRGTFAPCN